MTRDSARHLRLLLVVAVVLAESASAQEIAPYAVRGLQIAESGSSAARWSFGPAKPHIRDAVRRSAYGLVTGSIGMAIGLGMNELNSAQCNAKTICTGNNPVQAGMSFAFLGTLFGATGPRLSSKCTRSGRAMLGIVGQVFGAGAAGAIADVRLFNATSRDRATLGTMSAGMLGLGVGAGVVTAIC